jgi:predicted lipoprotein with Yx(FWY)xxD motif
MHRPHRRPEEITVHLRTRTARSLAALAALAFAAAACGDDDDDSTATDGQEAAATTTTAADTTSAAAELVEVVDSDLGEILASEGRTLYAFLPDAGGAPTCYGDCAATWPPLLADAEVTVGEGLDASSFATVARDDGGEQVTVDGWPLYFFANDAAPGDTNGQGVGERWYVVAPDGTAIQAAADTGTGTGYGD